MATVSDITNLQRSGVTTVDALLGEGPSWNYVTSSSPNVIYFTFANDGVHTDAASAIATFGETQRSATRQAVAYVESVTGIDFVETPLATQAQIAFLGADLLGSNVSGLTSWESSYRFTSGNVITSYEVDAEIFLDIVDFKENLNPVSGTSGYETILHELGHALGLKHPFEGNPQLPDNLDDTNHTLMSYTSVGDPKTVYQQYDLAALWWIYGSDGLGGTHGINSSLGPTLTPPPTDTVAPTAISFSPPDDASDVKLSENIVITFSETIGRGNGSILLKTADGNIVASYAVATSSNVSVSGATLTLNPTANLAYGTQYIVELAAGSVIDLAGNSYAGTTSYNFTSLPDPVNQILTGTSGNDVLTGGTGNDSIDGGGGVDAATFSLTKDSYILTKTTSGFTVAAKSGTDGTDTLTSIERLWFSDKKIALDLTPEGNAGKTLEFIGMLAFDFIHTPTVIGNILSIFDQGNSMHDICQLAIDVGLTRELAGSDSNLDLAKLVFRNVVGAEASDGDANALAG